MQKAGEVAEKLFAERIPISSEKSDRESAAPDTLLAREATVAPTIRRITVRIETVTIIRIPSVIIRVEK